jgi:hypothetical protein
MAYTSIDDPTLYFNTKLYTGNGSSSHAITGVGFQPDWVWSKSRSNATEHNGFDSVRGATEQLYISADFAESTQTESLKSFDSDGFTLGTRSDMNGSSVTYASWNWKANGAGSSNTDGSITSTVSANTTSGFSIATYTGNNTNAQTIGHGLGVAPKVYIIKRRDSTSAWGMYHGSLGANKYLQLESTNAEATDTGIWNNTAPTSSVLSIGNAGYFNNASGGTYVCYAFAEKKGFSKFGSYVGNGSTDGSYIHLGFKPAWVMVKQTDEARDWLLMDNKRLGYNPKSYDLHPNTSDIEDTNDRMDLLSNGFKQTTIGSANNKSGATYIYMAFAENPFVTSTGVPTTAR